jgi:hypothetical protein
MLHQERTHTKVFELARSINMARKGFEVDRQVYAEAIELENKYPLLTNLWRDEELPPLPQDGLNGLNFLRSVLEPHNPSILSYLSRNELFSLIAQGKSLGEGWNVKEDFSNDFHIYIPGEDLPETDGFKAWQVNEGSKRVETLGLTLQWTAEKMAVAKSANGKHAIVLVKLECESSPNPFYSYPLGEGKYAILENFWNNFQDEDLEHVIR